MSVNVIYIAGVPASGKTTLFKRIREHLFNEATEFKFGKCKGVENGAFKMLGVFDGSTFEGTDRLSMTVIDDAIAYVKQLDKSKKKNVIFVEGDRLFNIRFLRETKALLLLIDADERVLKKRHAKRGDNQTETFLKSRRSKVENFVKKYNVQRVWNNTQEEHERILSFILKTAKKYVE